MCVLSMYGDYKLVYDPNNYVLFGMKCECCLFSNLWFYILCLPDLNLFCTMRGVYGREQ